MFKFWTINGLNEPYTVFVETLNASFSDWGLIKQYISPGQRRLALCIQLVHCWEG